MSYPFWISPPALGTFDVTHSFTQNPLIAYFGESADLPCYVSLLNGRLPPGVSFKQNGFAVVFQGIANSLQQSEMFEFTLRASNQTYVADLTFNLQITVPPMPISFEWITNSNQPLGTVYNGNPFQFQVQARVDPLQPVFFFLNNIDKTTRGISIQSYSGIITIDLSWKPNTFYTPENLPKQTDYVFNNDYLYKCVGAGTSSSYGPLGTGTNIPDTDYPAWQPNSYYDPNSVVYNDNGKLYRCTNSGFSSNSLPGPTGTVNPILDNDLQWEYFDQAPLWDYISLTAPDVIPLLDPTSNFLFVLLPESTMQFISNFYQINLVSLPAGPVWVTPNNVPLVTLPSGSEFSFQLEAFDPDGQALVWTITTAPPNIFINNVGLLYGTLPSVTNTTSFSITVDITDGITINTRTFTVVSTYDKVLFDWIGSPDLGISKDGAISDKQVQATSITNPSMVSYGLSGGMLPPGVILNQQTGVLQGFIEFHAQDKLYWFEITANDSTQDVVQQFSWTIQSQNLGLHWNLSIPILGNQRLELLGLNNNNVIDENQLYLGNSQGWGKPQTLEIPIISGIKRINQVDLKNLLSNYLHNFRLRLNYFTVTDYADSDFQVVSVAVQDADSVEPWQPNTDYHTNKRVTSPDGNRYVALKGGKSGSVAPRGSSTSIKDGTVTWSFDSTPLPLRGAYWPLPWYPYHYYLSAQSVTNNGNTYESNLAGYTSGGPGPQTQGMEIPDNQVTWKSVNNQTSSTYGNLYWPADIFNLRKFSQDYVGFSNAWGQLAELSATVDSQTSGISNVGVINPGTGYYSAPVLTVVGTGQGATLAVDVGVISVTLVSSTGGFLVGDQITVDLGSDFPATLEIVSVSLGGIADSLTVINTGKFTRVPSNNITLFKDSNSITVKLDAGIVAVQVLTSGQGYISGQTTISVQGQEIDIAAQQLEIDFNLELPIGFVKQSDADLLRKDLANILNPFLGIIVPATLVKTTVTGIQWQGHARFDQNQCVFDGDQTRFIDFTPATETLFDNNNTYMDNFHTTFDGNWLTQFPDWSPTVFENGQTIFDYYRTLFDQRSAVFESRYSKSSFWYFGQPFDI